jgi:hypothetical protein
MLPKGSKKKAQSVFWSGDCTPKVNALSHTYKNQVLNINGGKLIVKGDYNITSSDGKRNSYGYLKMVNKNDYVLVNGNFTMYSYNDHRNLLTAGILEVKGNFTQLSHIKPNSF